MEEQCRCHSQQSRKIFALDDDNDDDDDIAVRFLSQPLFHRILSFLPCRRDVVSSAAVCKSWNRACSSFPILDFHTDEFVGVEKGSIFWYPGEKKGKMRRLERMIEFVDATMTRFEVQRLNIDKFKFHQGCSLTDAETDWVTGRINRWIDIAIGNNVREISVVKKHDIWLSGPYILISPKILCAPHLRSLTLSGVGLSSMMVDDTAAASVLTNLKSLQSLKIHCCPMDDRYFKRLVSGCSTCLENLSIDDCSSLREIRISGLPNIKTMFLQPWESDSPALVLVEAPSLESFEYYASEEPHAVTVNQSKNLKILKMVGVPMKGEWFEQFLSNFPVLEQLTIAYCDALTGIKISNPLLKRICLGARRELIDICLGTPELTMLSLYNGAAAALPSIKWTMNNISSPSVPCSSSSSKCKADLYFSPTNQAAAGPNWSCTKLREFLFLTRSSNFFKHLSLSVRTQIYQFKLGVEYGGNGVDKWSGTLDKTHDGVTESSYLVSGEHSLEVFWEKVAEIQGQAAARRAGNNF